MRLFRKETTRTCCLLKVLPVSPASDVGHTAALIPPLQPHLSCSSPASSSTPPSCWIPSPSISYSSPFIHLHFHPPPLYFIFFILYDLFFTKLPPGFELTSHVGEWAPLKPPLAPSFCPSFILASWECIPSCAPGEPTGVHMMVLCSQTAMNNETEVRHEVADVGRREEERERCWAPTPASMLSSRMLQLDALHGRDNDRRGLIKHWFSWWFHNIVVVFLHFN